MGVLREGVAQIETTLGKVKKVGSRSVERGGRGGRRDQRLVKRAVLALRRV